MKNKKVLPNKSTILRVVKDNKHPFIVLPNYFVKGDYDYVELAILCFLSSNSDNFIIVKSYVQKFLKIGYKNFNKAWKSLENKGHLYGERKFGHWIWVYSEKSNKQGTLVTDGTCVTKSSNIDKDNTLIPETMCLQTNSTEAQLMNNNKMNNNKMNIKDSSLKTLDSRGEKVQGSAPKEQEEQKDKEKNTTTPSFEYNIFSEDIDLSEETFTDTDNFLDEL